MSQPGRTCSGATVGSLLHLGMAVLKAEWRLECPLLHSPGGAVQMTDLLAGRVAIAVENYAVALPLVRDGRLRALAVTTPARLPYAPDTPAVAELLPGYEAVSWLGLLGPRGLPDAIAERLAMALREPDAETVERLTAMGAVALNGDGAALAARIAEQSAKWGAIIRANGIVIE